MDESRSETLKWRARLFIYFLMLVLAFAAAVLMDIHSRGYWFYSQAICVIYAVLSLGLSVWMKQGGFWKQLLLWVGLLIAIYVVNIFVQSGLIVNDTGAGVVTLTLLAITVYADGVYGDLALLLVAAALVVLSVSLALVQHYLLLLALVFLIIAIVIIFTVRRGWGK